MDQLVANDMADVTVRLSGYKISILREMKNMQVEAAVGLLLEMGWGRFQSKSESERKAHTRSPGYRSGVELVSFSRQIPERTIVKCLVGVNLELTGTLVEWVPFNGNLKAKVQLTPASLNRLAEAQTCLKVAHAPLREGVDGPHWFWEDQIEEA